MDSAALRSQRRVREALRATCSRLDQTLLGAAQGFEGAQVEDFMREVRGRYNVAVTHHYARSLLERAGCHPGGVRHG